MNDFFKDDDEDNDPFLDAVVEWALAPYKEMLPAELLEHYRELLGDLLATHPVGVKMLERARPRRAVDHTTGVEKSTGEAPKGARGRVA